MTGCVACAPMTELRWQKSEQIGISLRHSCACITRLLASPRLTTVGLFALVVAVAAKHVLDLPPTWTLLAPAVLLALNLAAALVSNPGLSRSASLFAFHVALLAFLVLAAVSRLTYLDGRVEVTEGAGFPGRLDDFLAGPVHFGSLREVDFLQGRITVPYQGDKRDGLIKSEVTWIDTAGIVYRRILTDHDPITINNYRFTPTSNKGFAAIFEWSERSGAKTVGSVHFPSYPQNRLRQVAEWRLPGGVKVWAMLEGTDDANEEDRRVWFDTPKNAGLVLRSSDERIRVQPGDSVPFGHGHLRYLGLRTWMGYRVFYDPTAPWMLASAMVASLALTLHLFKILRLRQARKGANP